MAQPQQPAAMQPQPGMENAPANSAAALDTAQVHGMKMLNISKDHKYTLNLPGLQALLLRADVKDLPVVVVTVAGAYRRGKSFLLDYFLRYLQAPREKQMNGEWLGDPAAPLTGFSWRGGSERHTTGMLMWPQPVFAYLPSGQKVLVILCDTQGTFDSESTVRDDSTVFALSALISSVLIFNLKENIQEDDLQHLQHFTKYGELVKTKNDKAFQILEFLVRDYPYPDENPYGQRSGEKLLNLRLNVTSNMPEQKRSLREHIRSAYETVTAYLMPHPGFKVRDKSYNGNHGVLDEDFKEHLKVLAESLFSPEKLALKKISGGLVKAKELVTYIKTYVDVFDSDQLPEPMDIVKATTEAGLLLAARESREMYEWKMEKECGEKEPGLPVQHITAFHKRTMLQALLAFRNKKKLGNDKEMKPYITKLEQELEKKLEVYVNLNKGKLMAAIADANAEYDKQISDVTQGKPLCLHPTELGELHKKAEAAAKSLFDSKWRQIPNIVDEARTRYMKDIADRLEDQIKENTRNNRQFLSESIIEYNNAMNSLLTKDPPLNDETFENKHQEELAKAVSNFKGHRNIESHQPDDSFNTALVEKIQIYFLNIKNVNRSKHRRAMHAAIMFYKNAMDLYWDPDEDCLHPNDLKKKHKETQTQAMKMFKNDADGSDELEVMTVSQNMELYYRELKELNDAGNEAASAAAYRKYKNLMDENCSASAWWILVVPIIYHYAKKKDYHKESKEAAIDLFYSKRKDRLTTGPDRYFDRLSEKLDDAFKMY